MSGALLYEARGLVRRYGEREALRLSEFTLRGGEALVLSGPNGSGKSTLLRVLAFLEKPQEGEVIFHGTPGVPPRLEVTLLLQEPYLLKCSVFENVVFGLRARGVRDGLEGEARKALAAVDFDPDDMLRRERHELSGGERQRVALAARLVLKPRVLLLDEPTSNVDAQSASAIHRAVRAAVAEGRAVVAAGHDRIWLDALGAGELRLG